MFSRFALFSLVLRRNSLAAVFSIAVMAFAHWLRFHQVDWSDVLTATVALAVGIAALFVVEQRKQRRRNIFR